MIGMWPTLNLTLHVLAAVYWLGGMLFLAAVEAPALRRLPDAELRRHLFEDAGRRFRRSGWVAIVVLLVTGVLNLHFRGALSDALHGDPVLWGSRWGHALGWKLGIVGTMLTIAILHDFVYGPRASRKSTDSSRGANGSVRAARSLARVNAILGILIIYFAVRLVRG